MRVNYPNTTVYSTFALYLTKCVPPPINVRELPLKNGLSKVHMIAIEPFSITQIIPV